MHEFFSVLGFQYATIASHRFGDEITGAVARVVKSRRMELDELHILHDALGTIHHGDAIAGCHQRIRCLAINGLASSRSHDGDF